MERGRHTWTDARLDDLSGRVGELGTRMDAGFARVDAELRAVNGRLDSFQRTMVQVGGGIIAALIALIATQL